MKKLFLLYLICAASSVKSQVTEAVSPITTISAEDFPSNKGNWQFLFRENVSFESRELKSGDEKVANTTALGINIGANYFVADHIAVGLQLNADFNKIESVTDFITKQNAWMTWGNFTYMTGLSESINIYGRAGIGVGGSTETYSWQDQKNKINIFGYKAEVGFPIQVASDAPLYFTPRLYYRHLNYDFDGGEEQINKFGLGLNFETYLPCRQMGWDRGNVFSSGRYQQGSSYLGFYTNGMLSFGNTKVEYDDDNFDDDEEDYFKAKLAGEYMYYAFNKVAIGAQVRFMTQSQEDKVSGAEYSTVRWGFRPTVEFNMPGKAQNLFVRGGVGFAGQTYDDNGNNPKSKVKIMNYGGGIGYNIFIARRISLTPIIGYESETEDFDDEDEDDKASGFDFSMGMRYHF